MQSVEEIRRTNLIELTKRHGGQRKLADLTGLASAQISQWINRAKDSRSGKPRVMRSDSARNVEQKLGLPNGWMDHPHDSPIELAKPAARPIAVDETARGYVRFPLLEGFAGMGRGDYVGDYPEIVEFVEVTREWAAQKLRGIPVEAIRVITGRGDSMRGQYSDGDLVFVDARIKQFLGDSAYCYRWNGQVQIKRLQLVGRGLVRILSENPKYPPIEAPLEELEIGGRALAAWTLHEF
jgi:phage repressor protein C with HTH and peptisase S24 domain